MQMAVTEKAKTVIFVSINERCPKNIEDVVLFCKRNYIYLIEDAAQILGGRMNGKHLDFFSTQKIIIADQ